MSPKSDPDSGQIPPDDGQGLAEASHEREEGLQLIGESEAIRSIRRTLPKIARLTRPTLLRGPTGSGKEVVARILHQMSARSHQPFVTVHCGALPEHLIESELFGHVKGAFTGATHRRRGLIRSAQWGTLFLDEVNSLSVGMQSRLLRFLESREYRAVGMDREERSDAWVIAATNEDLEAAVERGIFRADLLYRLEVICVDIPPLSARGEDALVLAEHFLEHVSQGRKSLTASARQALLRHAWPGNVRELKHRVEAAALLTEDHEIDARALGFEAQLWSTAPSDAPASRPLAKQLWSLVSQSGMSLGEAVTFCEEMIIQEALLAERENRTRAAERLGIHVRTIFKKLSHSS